MKSVAVITGGAGLLGREHAIALASDHSILLIDNDSEKLKGALEAIHNELPGSDVYLLQCDITSEHEVERAVNEICNLFDKIDVLINNAALNPVPGIINPYNRFENFDPEQWRNEYEVGLTGTLLMCKYVGRVMLKQNSGVVINIRQLCQ